MIAAWVKVGFGVITALLYGFVAWTMIDNAMDTVDYTPNSGTDWIVALTGSGIIAFVAAQIGVVVGTPGDGTLARLETRLFGAAPTPAEKQAAMATLIVLIVDLVVLLVAAVFFVLLYVQPEHIAVKEGADKLKDAPDYITLQAQALIGLFVVGGGGVGIAAAKGG